MRKLLCILLILGFSTVTFAQSYSFRKGNRQFDKGDYAEAENRYREGLLKDSTSVVGHYNLANALYRQGNYDEAAKELESIQLTAGDEPFAADYYFNAGNVAAAKEDWQTAVNMFKESLRRNPGDLAAKENYIYARNKLQQQQNQQQQQDQNQNQQQNQDQNQDQQQDQDQNQNQDQQKDQNQDKDQQDQNQDKDQQNQDQENQDQKNQDKDKQQDNRQGNQQPQPQETQLSPQQAQQLLQAIQEKEKQTQEKVDEKKAVGLASRQKEKNW
ncbi:MAG: tetratricopeptide repeat protein [Bacteroidales bacterium]|nr:tetratricopeptide repeat protein [Bacteroidales bacterium]